MAHNDPTDDAIREGEPPLAPRLAPFSTSDVCPRCGSRKFRALKPNKDEVLTADRECKGCKTCYLTIPTPVRGAVRMAMYATGIVLILGGVLAAVLPFVVATQPEGLRPTFQFGLIFSFMMGVMMFRAPHQRRQEREKRLQAYEASAPPDAPAPVEISQGLVFRGPEAVQISTLFGMMALLSPLVSALVTVLVFGPAAVVAGAVAVIQGHAKGLIGLLLGIAGVIVWGLVFVYVFQPAR